VKATPEQIATIYELIGQMPHTFSELYRITGIRPQTLKWILMHLIEKQQAEVINVDVDMERYNGLLKYNKYKLYMRKKRFSQNEINEIIEEHRKMSMARFYSTKIAEQFLGEACIEIYGKENVEVSPYEALTNDVLVHDHKLAFEITLRYDNPVDTRYITKKCQVCPDEYTLALIYIKIQPSAKKDAELGYIFRRNIILRQLPYDGFPIMLKYSALKPTFEKHYSKINLTNETAFKNTIKKTVMSIM